MDGDNNLIAELRVAAGTFLSDLLLMVLTDKQLSSVGGRLGMASVLMSKLNSASESLECTASVIYEAS